MSAQALEIHGNILVSVNNDLIDDDGHVIIPKGVISIGEYAFFNCVNITTVTFPESLTSIGEYAFGWCRNITTIKILAENPEEFKKIKNQLPRGLQVKTIIAAVFESVSEIKERALNHLLFNNNTNILKTCGTEDSLYKAIIKSSGEPYGAELLETLKIINTYDKSRIYKQIKRQLDALSYPADEGGLIRFEEDCIKIVNEAIDKASSLNKHPDVYPEASNNFRNDCGFFKRIRANTNNTPQPEGNCTIL